jgi:hypothetical protein
MTVSAGRPTMRATRRNNLLRSANRTGTAWQLARVSSELPGSADGPTARPADPAHTHGGGEPSKLQLLRHYEAIIQRSLGGQRRTGHGVAANLRAETLYSISRLTKAFGFTVRNAGRLAARVPIS